MQVIIQSVSDILWFKGIKAKIDFPSYMQNNSLLHFAKITQENL